MGSTNQESDDNGNDDSVENGIEPIAEVEEIDLEIFEDEIETHELVSKKFQTNVDDKEKESDRQFDLLVGILECMLLDEKFVSMVTDFGSKYCIEFDEVVDGVSANKLIYFERFVQYNEMIEHFMEKYVIDRMRKEGLHAIAFRQVENMVSNRLDEITGDVADVLLSFSDFEEFKEMMFSHKQNHNLGRDLSSLVSVHSLEPSQNQ
mmetsp:Transcript_80/g.142  ORF Transcript_80/g.142 Transcript_80/m.142 type:complete len:206 (-) Transcript_80:66-683(-)|eukprot:CAMPEP_0172431438 /NCGR_PEP_ID=MMETSP1064-20121228/58542_1 /TAXON_ID=202472 /ORGANISM="Aulacoseira subarctica , Strain CCAP 1002/5" /LENGTH=205 /DNA_ID=CAMNT_0013178131 /DNA_START=220 /DNA_END=837 /DNA_ORIENTATION=-